jgi:hypothetical protein
LEFKKRSGRLRPTYGRRRIHIETQRAFGSPQKNATAPVAQELKLRCARTDNRDRLQPLLVGPRQGEDRLNDEGEEGPLLASPRQRTPAGVAEGGGSAATEVKPWSDSALQWSPSALDSTPICLVWSGKAGRFCVYKPAATRKSEEKEGLFVY